MPLIRRCAECGTPNRVPARRLADRGTCGRCRAALAPVSEPIDVGPVELDEVMREAPVPVLVDFWAEWCGPCKLAAAEVKRTAADMAGRALVLKVDTERHPELGVRFGVRGIPNFVVSSGGRTVVQQAGLVDHRAMEQWLLAAGARRKASPL